MPVMIVSFLFSMSMFGIFFYVLYNIDKKKGTCTCKTTATVREIQEDKKNWYDVDFVLRRYQYSGDRHSSYPVYEYYVNGINIRRRGNVGIKEDDFYPGQTVELYYNPENPDEIYVPQEAEFVIAKRYLIFALLFMLIIIIPAIVFVFLTISK